MTPVFWAVEFITESDAYVWGVTMEMTGHDEWQENIWKWAG